MYFSKIKIVLACVLVIMFISSCEKMQNFYIGISSKEQKIIYKTWMLHGATKDGVTIPFSQYCAFNTPKKEEDLNFTTPGEVAIKCKLLFTNFQGPRGTWQLKEKKHIEITITDSSYYDNVNNQNVYVPVDAVKIKWEIISLTRNNMRVKELRPDGVYEFSFTNDY